MNAAEAHHHRTTTIGEAAACDTCGRLMTEIRAERAARPSKARAPRVDARTPEMKIADNERRRARRRAGR